MPTPPGFAPSWNASSSFESTVVLAGADLRDADASETLLSATRFFESLDGDLLEARVEGLRWSGARGLLESQEEFLRRASGTDS